MAESYYRVKGLVDHDATRPEALGNIIDTLSHLDSIIDNAFSRISARTKQCSAAINVINRRVEVCKARIKIVARATHRATTVFSFSKYPAASQLHESKGLFPVRFWGSPSRPRAGRHTGKVGQSNAAERVNTWDLYADLRNGSRNRQRNGEGSDGDRVSITEREGLGRLPQNLLTVSNLLLFNSDQNLYQNYSSVDNLVSSWLLKERSDEDADDELADAPRTLMHGADLSFLENPMAAMRFAPAIEGLKPLDIQRVLPLQNIAMDLNFLPAVDMAQSSIAPSSNALAAIEDLESLPPIPTPARTFKAPLLIEATPDQSRDIRALPPPSFPEHPVADALLLPVSRKGKSLSSPNKPPSIPSAATPAAAVSPPESSIPAPPISLQVAKSPSSRHTSPPSTTGGGRAGLLLQIQQGKKLRRAKHKRSKRANKPIDEPQSHMQQLRILLQRHREGITGRSEIKMKPQGRIKGLDRKRQRQAPRKAPPRKRSPAPLSPPRSTRGLFAKLKSAIQSSGHVESAELTRRVRVSSTGSESASGWISP